MKLVENAFLVLGLSNESSLKELQRREKEIKNLIKNDEFPEYEADLDFSLPIRTLHSLQEAKQSLSGSKIRVLHDFFWFNLSEAQDEKIFNIFKNGNYLFAFEEWNNISQGNELKNYISKKNYSLSIALLSQVEKVSIKEIEKSLHLWKEILDSDKYWNFFEKNYLLSDELEIDPSYFLEFREDIFFKTLESIYLEVWKKQGDEKVISIFCDIFSDKNLTIQDNLLIPIYEKIEKSISILENLNAGEDGILDDNEKEIIKNEKSNIQIQLNKLKELNFYDISRSKDLRDRIADVIRMVTVDINNNIEEYKYAKNLISFAKEISGTDSNEHKMNQSFNVYSENLEYKEDEERKKNIQKELEKRRLETVKQEEYEEEMFLIESAKRAEKEAKIDTIKTWLFWIVGIIVCYFIFAGDDDNQSKKHTSYSSSYSTPSSTPKPIKKEGICGNKCMFNGKCMSKPANGYCVENDKNNAWKCEDGYKDTGSRCVYQGYSVLKKNITYFRGYGQLEINNSEGSKSYIKILKNNTVIFDFFLDKGENYTLKGISNGTYSFYSCSGFLDKDTNKREVSSCSKFDSPLVYTTKNYPTYVEYSVQSITLYKSILGNAKTSYVSPDLFEDL